MNTYGKIDALNQVAEFHHAFGHPVLDAPSIPSEKRCALRISLISEELKELEAAVKDKNIIEIADALCDIQYVLSGAVLEFGLADKFIQLFDEVQRSNMSKACLNQAEAELTVKHYKENHGIDCHYTKINDVYLVYRNSDNKTLKSVNYSPADLHKILK